MFLKHDHDHQFKVDHRHFLKMELLQMGSADIECRIQEELESNPVLEEGSNEAEEWLAAVGTGPTARMSVDSPEAEISADFLGRSASPPDSLAEHLDSQVNLLKLTAEEERAARYIVRSLDEMGYLHETDVEVAKETSCMVEDVRKARASVRSLDPAGCGSRTLEECLDVQMRDKGVSREDAERILRMVAKHLRTLKAGRLGSIARELGVSQPDVVRLLDILKGLNPAPGRAHAAPTPTWVVPEASFVKRFGCWHVVSHHRYEGRVRITSRYRTLLSAVSAEDRRFLRERIGRARLLISAIANRGATVRRVLEAIARRQVAFLEHGPAALEPLTFHDVAQEIGVHATTVGRAVRDKYVETPFGVRSLAYFFPERLVQPNHTDVATRALQERIRTLVLEEDGHSPLSDQGITDALAAEGIKVSRRAVRNYRAQLGIGNSADRRGVARLRSSRC